ncbi:MAG: CvpA family protein [Cocleimonas sp.]|nr:CvpA family protein [Cocleimonas sp.]
MDFNYIDLGIVVVVLLTALVGMVQGFVWMTIFLVTWIAAISLTYAYAPILSKAFPFQLSNELIQMVIAGLLIFLGVLLVGALLNFLFGKAINAIGIGAVDRLFGTGLGVVLGILILSLLTMLATITPFPDQKLWRTSVLIPQLEASSEWVKSFVPPEIEEYFKLPAETEIPTRSIIESTPL